MQTKVNHCGYIMKFYMTRVLSNHAYQNDVFSTSISTYTESLHFVVNEYKVALIEAKSGRDSHDTLTDKRMEICFNTLGIAFDVF